MDLLDHRMKDTVEQRRKVMPEPYVPSNLSTYSREQNVKRSFGMSDALKQLMYQTVKKAAPYEITVNDSHHS